MIESISVGTARQRRRVYVRRRMRSIRSFLCCAVVMSALAEVPSWYPAAAAQQAATAGAQDSSGTSNLDERLFRDLGGLNADDAARGSEIHDRPAPGVLRDPAVPRDLSRHERDQISVVQQMLQVRARLSRADAGAETQRVQQQILKQLEQWLEPQGDSAQAAGSAPGSSPQAARSEPAGRPPRGPTPGSDADVDASATRGAILAGESPRGLLERAWGGLPASVRQQLQSVGQEQFLPQYAPQIEAYYRALSAVRAKDR